MTVQAKPWYKQKTTWGFLVGGAVVTLTGIGIIPEAVAVAVLGVVAAWTGVSMRAAVEESKRTDLDGEK